MVNLEKLFENFEDLSEPTECKITGVAPEWLKGTMVRNGPGLFKAGETECNHWFDGMAYIQRYHFTDGRMMYSARFLDTDHYRTVKAADRWVVSSFGTFRYPDPCKSIYQRFMSHFQQEEMGDNALVSFVQVGDAVYAVTELPKMVQLDLDTLDAVKTVNVADKIAMNTYTAHHQGDYEGNTYNIGSRFGKNGSYVFTKTKNPQHIEGAESGSLEGLELCGEVPQTDMWAPGYYHSFGMSENYFVLFESPLRISTKKLIVRNLLHYSFQDALYWSEELDTNVLVLDKRTGKAHTIKYTSPPFFTFHHANTFESDGFLITDYCHIKNPGKFDDLLMEHMRSGTFNSRNPNFKPYLHRMVIPTVIPEGAKPGDNLAEKCELARGAKAIFQEDGSIRCEDVRLSDVSFEFPRYNWEGYNLKPYKFVYGSTLLFEEHDETKLAGVVKVDTSTGQTLIWYREHEEQLCAEPIFVSKPDAQKEDDGVLIVPVMTVKDNEHPFVVVLSAEDLSEICRYEIPADRIPPGFHAHYVSRE